MLFGSTSAALIAAHRAQRQHNEEVARRQAFEVRHRLLTGDFLDVVREEVRRIFTDPAEAERVGIVGDSHCNVFKFVVDEVYQFTGAKRAFVRPDGTRDEVYERLERDVEPFDLVMQEVVTTLGGCNDALLQVLPGLPLPDGSVGRPRIRVFRPHECTVFERPDDPSQPEAVIYPVYGRNGDIDLVYWSATEHFVISDHGPRSVAGAVGAENPYGRLPFVAIHAGLRADGFWDTSTNQDMVEFSLQYLAGWSAVRHLMHQQSFKQLAAYGVPDDWTAPAKMGPAAIWKFTSPDVRLEALDLRTDPHQLADTLERMLAQHLASKGLNPDKLGQNPGQAPPSGLALYLDRQRVLERRKKIYPSVVEAEYALAELYRWAWNWNHDEQIDEDAQFEVELIEETVVLSPTEQEELRGRRLQNFKLERELGLRSVVEQLAFDRGISVEEAERVIRTIPPLPEVFAYDQENGIVTLDEIRAFKGLGPHPNPELGRRTIPELRRDFPGMFSGGSSAASSQE